MDPTATAITSGDAALLLWTALAMGFVHTVLGPDHYVPFVALAKAGGWRARKLAWMTTLAGLGHVATSVLLAALLAAAGLAVGEWDASPWAAWHERRGSVAAWLLMGLGAAIAVHGFVNGVLRARRDAAHAHPHVHADGTVHAHGHDHRAGHLHPHAPTAATAPRPAGPLRRATPWVLFLVFLFGPCETLIPLVLAAVGTHGPGLASAVALTFAAATIAAMLACVFLLRAGLRFVPAAGLERHAHTLAGLSLVACGASIEWLGL